VAVAPDVVALFDDETAMARGAEALGDDEAGETGSDDDEVVGRAHG
jgi:hypothetical protein